MNIKPIGPSAIFNPCNANVCNLVAIVNPLKPIACLPIVSACILPAIILPPITVLLLI